MIKKLLYKIIQSKRKRNIREVGNGVLINKGCTFKGNIYLGSNVVIGENNYFVSTKANLIVHDYVVFGPNVTIYTGDHKVDVIGKHIIEVTDNDKLNDGEKWDKDVIIESGCWIGTRAIILKGVTIGKGSIVGAGSIVTRDIPPYHIYVGTPQSNLLKRRFTDEQIKEHEKILKSRNVTIQ